MTEPKDAPNDPFGEFVVMTEVKPDGRIIHYYEWPAAKEASDSPKPSAPSAPDADGDV